MSLFYDVFYMLAQLFIAARTKCYISMFYAEKIVKLKLFKLYKLHPFSYVTELKVRN